MSRLTPPTPQRPRRRITLPPGLTRRRPRRRIITDPPPLTTPRSWIRAIFPPR